MRELRALEESHPDLLTPDSPTQRVGGQPVEGFATVAHRAPMLSLDNAYNVDELRAFDERVGRDWGAPMPAIDYVAEPKIDGLSIALTYEAGSARPWGDARRRRARRRGDRTASGQSAPSRSV